MPLSAHNPTDTDVGDDLEFILTPQQLLPESKKPRPSKTSAAHPKQETKSLPRLDVVSMGPVACLEAIFKCTNVVYISADAPAGSHSPKGRKHKR